MFSTYASSTYQCPYDSTQKWWSYFELDADTQSTIGFAWKDYDFDSYTGYDYFTVSYYWFGSTTDKLLGEVMDPDTFAAHSSPSIMDNGTGSMLYYVVGILFISLVLCTMTNICLCQSRNTKVKYVGVKSYDSQYDDTGDEENAALNN